MRTRPFLACCAVVWLTASGLLAQSPAPDLPAGVRLGGMTVAGKQAGWRGIYPGKSRLEDLKKALGEPASSELESSGLTRYVFAPNEALKFNSAYVASDGTVKQVGWASFDEDSRVPARDLIRTLGEPKLLSATSYDGTGAICQWEAAGVWGVVNRERNAVLSLLFYDPAEPPQIQLPAGK